MKTPAPAADWRFRDGPDWPRICRELRESGCALGLVTVEKPGAEPQTFTLADSSARVWPGATWRGLCKSAPDGGCMFYAGSWRRFEGNAIKALLGVPTVEVRGFR